MRVALVYDRITKIGGAEQVLVAFHKLFPEADWYTSFWNPKTAPFSQNWRVHSFPLLKKGHEWFPWLMPFIFESYDFSSYDLVISIGSAESKGIITRPGTFHLNYCLTPTRYLYSHRHEHLTNSIYRLVGNILRKWDLVASTRPDAMIAISTQVKNRIKDVYNRDVDIIFPPVNTKKFATPHTPLTINHLPAGKAGKPFSYFLVVSRLVPYKKIDVLIRAANLSKQNLVVIGEGSEYSKLKKLAGPTVTLLGHVDDADLPAYYQNCLAFLQANEEDFGIAMCEALASGRPVIAYGKGGACDIVIAGTTGLLLDVSTPVSFAKAFDSFRRMKFDSQACRGSVARFDSLKWQKKLINKIEQYVSQ